MDEPAAGPGDFAVRLRRLRAAAALSQEELAERAGLTAKAIGALERGERRRPYPHTVRALADALSLAEADRLALAVAAGRRPDVVASPLPIASSTAGPAPTTLVGRDEDRKEVIGWLGSARGRLMTLTGPGGVGKTALALEVAKTVAAQAGWSVTYVDLAPVREVHLVLPTIARALGITQLSEPLLDSVAAAVGERRLLLVLDNVEQVLEAASDIAGLIGRCAGVSVLATSRAALRVQAELEWPLGALPVPSADDAASVATSPSGAVFLERARASGATLELNDRTAPFVAAICRRLDGLPLALELAAVHARFLPPRELLDRLDAVVDSPRSRDRPERQRTLQATLDWSHDLLTADEQVLLARLSVFAGGFDVSAAEHVFGDDVLVPLAGLVEQSLVMFDGVRHRLLEPVRRYAAARLEAAGRTAATAETAAAFFTDLAAAARAGLHGADLGTWLDLLGQEHANIAATMSWLVTSGPRGDRTAARIAADIWLYWALRGSALEGLDWLRRIRDEELDDASMAAASVARTGLLYATGDVATTREPAAVALAAARSAAPERLAEVLVLSALSAVARGDDAGPAADEAVDVATRGDDAWALSHANSARGQQLLRDGQLAAAGELLDAAESVARGLGNPFALATALDGQAALARVRGDDAAAVRRLGEAVSLAFEIRTTWTLAFALPLVAGVAERRGRPDVAVELLAAAAEAASVTVAYPPGSEIARNALAGLRDDLGDDAFESHWTQGRDLDPGLVQARIALVTGLVESG